MLLNLSMVTFKNSRNISQIKNFKIFLEKSIYFDEDIVQYITGDKIIKLYRFNKGLSMSLHNIII